MKIALVAESFLPHMNGVTGSVMHALDHLSRAGHELMVIAPDSGTIDAELHGARLELLRSFPLPSYPQVRMVFSRPSRIAHALRSFGAEAVHLASPFVLGWNGVLAAEQLRLPAIAVYQTDIIAYAEKYRVPGAPPLAAQHISRLHRRATLTLVPSGSAHAQLDGLGVDRLRRWGRGVDADRFAPERRSEAWRARVGGGRLLVGYVGRLAPEKQVEDLRVLQDLPGVQLVVIGDGPSRALLERQLPRAHFTGFLGGAALAEAVASLDVFVHPGESETFCQTVQEAHASGVPVVATGRGGQVDLVRSSVDGWLYRPGDLGELRARVADLTGDPAKRAAFAAASRLSVRGRTWSALCEQLVEHYAEAIELRRVDAGLLARGSVRPCSRPAVPPPLQSPRWRRYVALGDSITEGLCDSSRMPRGEYLGWAARLAMLLANSGGERGVEFANLAVRSRRVEHLEAQVTQALALEPDLVSVLIGANDLVLTRLDLAVVARRLEDQVARLRAAGIDVLLGTAFLPRRRAALMIARRFAEFNAHVRRIALAHDCALLDVETIPEIGDLEMWAEDRVHLTSAAHRLLAYRAAAVLGVPLATELGELEHALHDTSRDQPDEDTAAVSWLRAHALPWVWRRLRGRTAGDGIDAKHDRYVEMHAGGAGPA